MIRLRTAAWVLLLALARPGAAQEEAVWFDDLPAEGTVSEADALALARRVAAAVFRPSEAAESIPESLRADARPRILFLSASDGMSRCRVAWESGRGWAEALERGIARVRRMADTGSPVSWLKLDLVTGAAAVPEAAPARALEVDRSLDGLSFDRASRLAFLPEESLARGLLDAERRLAPDPLARAVGTREERKCELARALAETPLTLFRFTTAGVFLDGRETVPLYRGHRRFETLTPDALLAASRAGIRYLAATVTPEGRFDYLYRPVSHSSSKSYNVVRHAGTVMAMAEWMEVTGDRTFAPAMQRAVDYLRGTICPMPADSADAAAVVQDGMVQIGANALAAVAFAKVAAVTGDRALVPDLLRLGRWLQAMETSEGDFPVHTARYPGGEDLKELSDYYPGEAILAMARIHPFDPEGAWLDAAARAARRLIEVRDGGKSLEELYHDHWLLYALNDLHRLRPDPAYPVHEFKMARAILRMQQRTPRWPDWLGGYYEPPYSTPTATRSEGLNAAYRLARDFGAPEEATAIRAAIELGVRFELQTQYRPEQAMYFEDPQRVLGGFHGALEDLEVRIDYVQHNVSAMLRLYQLLAGK